MGKRARRVRAEAAPRAVEAPAPLIPPRPLTPGRPTALPSVYACVRLLVATASQMQLGAVQGGRPYPLPTWIRRPELGSSGMRLRDVIGYAVACQALNGWAAWWAEPWGEGWDIRPIDPSRTNARWVDDTRTRGWTLDGQPVPLVFPATTPRLRSGGLLVAPYLLVPDVPEPLGPLQAARHAIGGYLDVEAFAGHVFPSGRGQSGRYLKTEQDLPADTLTRYRDDWQRAMADPMAAIPALGGGLSVEDSMLDPSTAQWIQSREFNSQEIARLYGIPPRYLGLPSGDASTYATARDNDAQLLRYAASPIVDAIADAWSWLLPPGRNEAEDVVIRFGPGQLLAQTPLEENQTDEIAIRAGILTVDEVRARRGLGAAPAPAPTAEEVPA